MGSRSSRPRLSSKKVAVDASTSKDGNLVSSKSNTSTNKDSTIALECTDSFMSIGSKSTSNLGERVNFSSLKKHNLRALAIANKYMSTNNHQREYSKFKSHDAYSLGSSVCTSSAHLEMDEEEESSLRNFCDALGLSDGIHRWTFRSGDVYNGEWQDGMIHGNGILRLVNSKVVYRGDFQNGVYSGEGEMTYESGDVFTGSFVDGEKHGRGCVQYASGKPELIGIWKRDKLTKTILSNAERMRTRSGDVEADNSSEGDLRSSLSSSSTIFWSTLTLSEVKQTAKYGLEQTPDDKSQ